MFFGSREPKACALRGGGVGVAEAPGEKGWNLDEIC